LDFLYYPNLNFIENLRFFFKAKESQALLNKLIDDQEYFASYIRGGGRIAAEIVGELQELEKKENPTAKRVIVPMEAMIEGIRFMQCRYYSISSSPKVCLLHEVSTITPSLTVSRSLQIECTLPLLSLPGGLRPVASERECAPVTFFAFTTQFEMEMHMFLSLASFVLLTFDCQVNRLQLL
jgi:hypothetical protein